MRRELQGFILDLDFWIDRFNNNYVDHYPLVKFLYDSARSKNFHHDDYYASVRMHKRDIHAVVCLCVCVDYNSCSRINEVQVRVSSHVFLDFNLRICI